MDLVLSSRIEKLNKKLMHLLSEQAIQMFEAQIPKLAQHAFAQARLRALALGGRVMEVANGHLVETNADGSVHVIRKSSPSTSVGVGTKRYRKMNKKEISA
ncbi:hypothetical protein [Limnohabitans sp.]|uniref:hypothetical protein n=1 Tax=Limnohabitans sp. TaxID=1907725 RepID=UPI00286F7FA3|nr:hypothetical protein [Limnohabitans sp.]